MSVLNPQHITAVILAGGKGRRLKGNDKGLVEFQQQPMVEHVLQAVGSRVANIIINANRNIERYESYGHPVISDALSDFQGPLAGFCIAMSEASTSHILTLPCDGPFVSEDYVARMAQALSQDPAAEMAVAHDGERMQPVHALIPVSLLDSLRVFLASGERKIDRWYTQHKVALVDFSDKPEIFQNINTEAQLKHLEETDND